MARFDQLSSSSGLYSPPSATEMDSDSHASTLVSSSLPQGLRADTAVAVASSSPRTSSSFRQPPPPTSSFSIAKGRKQRRRKSRAKPKTPVRQVSANKVNFRDIVHQLTGAPPSEPILKQSTSPCCPPQTPGSMDCTHGMPSTPVNTSLFEKHKWLAGALLAQSLRALDILSSSILQSAGCFSESALEETTSMHNRTGGEKFSSSSSSCSHECTVGAARHDGLNINQLEDFLLEGSDSKFDPYVSLFSDLIKLHQIVAQCEALSTRS